MDPCVVLAGLYNDWPSADVLFREIGNEFTKRQWPAHLVIVNDGSSQRRPEAFLSGVAGFTSVEIVNLRRNMGHQRALAVGLSHIFESTTIPAVVVMDCDGEDRPDDLFRLLEKHAAEPEAGIVFAERTRRSEGIIFGLFYLVYRFLHFSLTGYRIRFGNFSVVPRRWLGALAIDPNLWLHFAATVVAARIPHTTIPTHRGKRLFGRSKLNFTSLVIHGLAALACYNEIIGVRLMVLAGLLSLSVLALIAGVIFEKVATPWAIPGWATYSTGILSLMLLQALMVLPAFSAIAISNRKTHFFFPLQQYSLLFSDIERLA